MGDVLLAQDSHSTFKVYHAESSDGYLENLLC